MAKYPTTEMCDGALLEAFEPTVRDTDIFCATAAKSGQTWLMSLMHHLRTRGTDPDMGGGDSFDVMPWLELPRSVGYGWKADDEEGRLAQLEALPDPRIFKMHVIYGEVPRPPGSGSRVVTVTRDVRDLPYSMFCHLRGMGRIDEDRSFDDYFERWIEFGYVFEVIRSFWPHREEPHLLWLRFEDMKADLRGQARRLSDFLGFDVDDATLDRVLPLVSMAQLQAREDRRRAGAPERSGFKEGSRFFREGAIGKNRAQLSPAQEARILERAEATLEPECMRFVFAQGL